MIVKAKTSPKPSRAVTGRGIVLPMRCTAGGELMVYQVNNPDPLADLVKFLRNVQLDPDGAVVVKHNGPIEVVPQLTEVVGIVSIEGTVTVEPVTVSNIPDQIKIQEPLKVQQISGEAKIAPFNFKRSDREMIAIPGPCKVYSIHLTVNEPTFVEIVGITGEMYVKELKLDLSPLFIQIDKVEVKTREFVEIGGYVVYEI